MCARPSAHASSGLGWWPHCRAALVTFHLAAIVLMALPSPDGALNRSQWADPTVQDELRAWTSLVNRDGAGVTPGELEENLFQWAITWAEVRAQVLAPAGLYAEYCGTSQHWQMFVAPHRYPSQLHLEVLEGGVWRPAYVERDAEHSWRAVTLDNYRFRSAIFLFAWDGYQEEYQAFAGWAAREAARDFPDAEAFRARFWRQRTPSAEEVRAGKHIEGAFERELVVNLRSPP